jgi:activating signal cointegrator complex subunit 1
MRELAGRPLSVPLTRVGIMQPEQGDPARAHVMWAGPPSAREGGEDVERLWRVCGVIERTFMDEGFVIDQRRPLKLHATLINTSSRRPRPRAGQRTPFDYPAVIAHLRTHALLPPAVPAAVLPVGSSSLSSMTMDRQAPSEQRNRPRDPLLDTLHADLGTWSVDELQICEMGSWGPEGEYVSVASVPLSGV